MDINAVRLTSCAGNKDDGGPSGGNGTLITVGGVGDSINNPANPNQQNIGEDDELYNLEPFLAQNDLQIVIETANPSGDDIVFLSVIAITAEAAVTTEICDDGIDNDGDGLIDGDDPDCAPELVFEKSTDCPAEFPIYSAGAVECSFTITFSGPAPVPLIIVDTVPAEWDVTGLVPSAGTTATATPQGAQQTGSTLIEWSIPPGTTPATLTVNIATRESNGRGHKNPVFKPTSCGELPINTGAEAFEDHGVIGTFELPLDVPTVAGPTNSLATEAVAGAEPCAVEGLEATTLSATSVSLSWTANSEDDGFVPGNLLYYVYRDEVRIATVTGGTSYTDSGLATNTMFCYQVNAAYTADPENDGNHSNVVSWPVLLADCDGDSLGLGDPFGLFFRDEVEVFMGTLPGFGCAATTGINDEDPDATGMDVDDSKDVDGSDVFLFAQRFGTEKDVRSPVGKLAYSQRFDIYPTGASLNKIDGSDMFVFALYFGTSCP